MTERLDLMGAKVVHELWLDESYLEKGIDLVNAHFSNRVTFDSTRSPGKLDLGGLRVEKDLSFREGKFGAVDLADAVIGVGLLMGFGTFESINAQGAKVGSRVDLGGAKVTGNVDMSGLQAGGPVLLDREAYFVGTVDLLSANVGAWVDLRDSTFGDMLSLQSLTIAGDLFMSGTKLRQAVLRAVSVGRSLQLSDSSISGKLVLENLRVGLDLLLNAGRFSEVSILSVRAGIDINLTGSTFTSDLSLDSVQAEGGLYLSGAATFEGVSLYDVRIGRLIVMATSKVAGNITLRNVDAGRSLSMGDGAEYRNDVTIDGLQVKGSAFIRDAKFSGDLSIIVSTIEASLYISGSELRYLDLSGTSIAGQLVFADPTPIQWQEKSKLVLRNTVVGAVGDSKECWPKDLTLVLRGFVYKTWGGLFGVPSEGPFNPTQWFANSLPNDLTYSPQPYEQLATVLKAMGYTSYADDVLFAGKKRALWEEPAPWYIRAFRTVFMVVIGFGHRLHYAVYWTLFFIAVGAFVVLRTPEGRHERVSFALGFSIEALLPLVKLREKSLLFDFEGRVRPARYYFYFHKAMGYVLASFLIAALTGLTK